MNETSLSIFSTSKSPTNRVTGQISTPVRLLLVGYIATALSALAGCASTMESPAFLMENGINDNVLGQVREFQCETGPGWATDPPRIDLFDTQCTDGEPITAPSPSAPSFSMDDLGVTERIATSSEFSLSDRAQNTGECYPKDEYVSDGGDRGLPAKVRNDWTVDGLGLEDTVAHFDTLAGDVQVVASNRACVYSPRFAATRQVIRPQQQSLSTEPTRALIVDKIAEHEIRAKYGAIKQPLATVRSVGTSIGTTVEEHQLGLTVDDIDIPTERIGAILPYENLEFLATGVFEVDEKASILHFANAAHAWSAVEFAQATVLGMVPTEQRHTAEAEATVVYEMPDGKAKLRLVKLADVDSAQPGETVEFVLRFDNVGNELIGNVTIIDKLTTRLKYVEESEECSIKADFFADDSDADTLALRWEIESPLEPGKGGVIRFKCRVQ